jgi:hypothetical protein
MAMVRPSSRSVKRPNAARSCMMDNRHHRKQLVKEHSKSGCRRLGTAASAQHKAIDRQHAATHMMGQKRGAYRSQLFGPCKKLHSALSLPPMPHCPRCSCGKHPAHREGCDTGVHTHIKHTQLTEKASIQMGFSTEMRHRHNPPCGPACVGLHALMGACLLWGGGGSENME